MAGRARLEGLACAALLGVALLACGQRDDAGSGGPQHTGGPPASDGGASPAGSATGATFTNPVHLDNFPDPFVFHDGDHYYAYATGGGGQNIQMARSPDLVSWEEPGNPLPDLPSWSNGETWAPEVARTTAGYVLYYTARATGTSRPDGVEAQCLAVAVGETAEGPFVDDSDAPMACQEDLGGSIDSTYFRDEDGTAYLAWKNDGNCCRLPTRFFIQQLSEDGLSLVGEPTDLGVVNDQPWEGDVIEAPTLLLRDGTYYLFYSGNFYAGEFYAVGYATADAVTGPYTDAPENPILASAWDRPVTARARGPGHQSVVADDEGDLWIAYHAWDLDAIGYENQGVRTLWIDELVFEDRKPVVKGPDDGPQPVP